MSKITIPGVQIGDLLISPASSVHNLGGMFDTEMSMRNQIANVKRLFTRLSPRDLT